MKNVLKQIESDMGEKLKEFNLTAEDIANTLQMQKAGFGIDLSYEEFWEQEKPYFIKFGMSAFDCGYCGKKL